LGAKARRRSPGCGGYPFRVVRSGGLHGRERCRPARFAARFGVGVDGFPYTLAEARRSLKEGWGVVGIALKEGRALYPKSCEIESLLAP
jgi:hypothetical protein